MNTDIFDIYWKRADRTPNILIIQTFKSMTLRARTGPESCLAKSLSNMRYILPGRSLVNKPSSVIPESEEYAPGGRYWQNNDYKDKAVPARRATPG